MITTLATIIDQFIKKQFIGDKDKTIANNLFKGRAPAKNINKATYAFVFQPALVGLLDKDIKNKSVQDMLPVAIHDSVRAYTRDKNKAIHIYSRFVRLLEESFGVHIEIEFPPVFNSPGKLFSHRPCRRWHCSNIT